MRLNAPSLLLALALLLSLVVAGSAQETDSEVLATYTLDDIPLASFQNAELPESPIADDRGMLLGGVGSDLWRASGDPAGEFWMVTDRGPNGQIEVDGANRRTFPVPDFTPLILHVRAEGTALTVLEGLPIVGQSGQPVTGLSNIEGVDETPYDVAAEQELAFNPSGLDSEGLVRTASGDFWLVDEYSPSLINVDAAGHVVKRYVPAGLALSGADYPVADVLPGIYGQRKTNRGFEGLAISSDEQTLYIALQSPLSNPNGDTGEASRSTRILVFDIASEQPVAEYVYRFEIASEFDPDPEVVPDDMKLSGVVALDATTLLILERTDAVARLYTVDTTEATDILGGPWDDPATSPTLESLADPAAEGITPLPKTLLVDLSTLEGMPGKIEGVAVVDQTTVAVANDNDFDIGEFDEAGRHVGDGTKSQLLLVQTPPIPGVSAPSVAIRGSAFRPARLEIAAGTTVTWTNEDGTPHTATGVDGTFDSGQLAKGGSFSHTFDSTGSYGYECFYHANMTGTIVVT